MAADRSSNQSCPDEASRLSTLHEFNILDTEAEREFDELTALAAQICDVPIALISLVDDKRQWFKSRVGLDVEETPRDIAFCAHAIQQPDQIFEIPDAQIDERFANNPLVVKEPKIRFYAGAPLIAANGDALGTLCVIDRSVKRLTKEQKWALDVLRRIVVRELELRRHLHRLKSSEGRLQSQNSRLETQVEKGAATLEQEVGLRNESELLSRQILDMALDGVISADKRGRVIYWNPEAERIFGYSAEYAWGRDIVELIFSPHQHQILRHGMQQSLEDGTGRLDHQRFEVNAVRADGARVPVEIAVRVFQRHGEYFFSGFIRDLTERNKTIEELRISAITFNSQDAIVITDAENKILRVNQRFTDVTGYQLRDVVGHEPSLMGSTIQDKQFYQDIWRSIEENDSWEGEIWDKRKNGEIFPLFVTITAIRDAKNKVTNYVFSFSDITAVKRDEDEIRTLAYFDPLTRLPNRRSLLDELAKTMAACSGGAKTAALLIVDLDNFRNINDTLGHQLGDEMLVKCAQRLSGCLRSVDIVARIGGDEFVVILQNLGHSLDAAIEKTGAVAEKILSALNKPYLLGEQEIHSGASIGATLISHHKTPTEDLFKQADIAMYQAKRSGRNKLCFFDQAMEEDVALQVQLGNALRGAIQNNQFELYYQVQVDRQHRPVGAEALIRWEHPQLGTVSPRDFIPLAEESDLILAVGDWVLSSACEQLARWQRNPNARHLTVAINISPRQFHQSDFVDTVLIAIAAAGIAPGSLKLELTESLILDNASKTIEKMHRLKQAGVEFALDDFGTGYSSLAYLSRLPLSQLKIDQSFVRNIGIKESDNIIVQTIIGMAHGLGMQVIAEGVESEAQYAFLEALECPLFQGYLFGKPLPLAEFEKLLG